MFLHIGGDVVVSLKSIISILDYESVIKSKDTRSFLQTAEEEGFVIKIGDQEPKSLIITEKVQGNRKGNKKAVQTVIYYSPISSVTLQKRANFLKELPIENFLE